MQQTINNQSEKLHNFRLLSSISLYHLGLVTKQILNTCQECTALVASCDAKV